MRPEALIVLIIVCLSPILLLALLFKMEGLRRHSLKIRIVSIILIALLICFWPVLFAQCPLQPANGSYANACYEGFNTRTVVFNWVSIPALIGTFLLSVLKVYFYQHQKEKSTSITVITALATGILTTTIAAAIGAYLFARYVFYFVF